ncbi:hypothetical protein [Croceimicrobium sp.]|uniref:hypothetical protein n=1 Tax=Croceimicrobium sp. TaxID=2828340 RepID=UPI003BAA075C
MQGTSYKQGDKMQTWRKDFLAKRKAERKSFLKWLSLLALGFTIAGYLSYLFFTDDLQFIGLETKITRAEVIRAKKVPYMKNSWRTKVTYQFEVDGQKFVGQYLSKGPPKFILQKISIRVKYARSNPKRNKFVEEIYNR